MQARERERERAGAGGCVKEKAHASAARFRAFATIQYGLTFTGLSILDASLAIIIVHLEVPFAVILAAVILKEKPGLQRLFGMLISFAGIALIAGQPNLQGQLLAVFLTASGAMMWALGRFFIWD